MPQIPTPIRAALGLAATAVAEARKLPETLPQLPVTAVSTVMQASLRVQQHIATFAARGDEVISQLRGTSAEPPSWATFDDAPPNSADGPALAAFDRAEPVGLDDHAEPANLEDTASGLAEPGGAEPAHPVSPEMSDTVLATSGEPAAAIDRPTAAAKARTAPKVAPAKAVKAPAKAVAKAPAKAVAKAAAAEAPAKKTEAPAKKAAKAAAKKAPAKKAVKQSEPLVEAAKKADPTAGPNPSTMAAEILQAHQADSPDQP